MSKKPLLRILESEAQAFFARQETKLIDIILFGSLRTGKEKPEDIDLLLLFKDRPDHALTQEFRRLLERKIAGRVEVIPKTYHQILAKEFLAREGLLTNGYSLIYRVALAEGLGFTSRVLFVYRLTSKTKSERMRFYYSLYGRGNEQGIVHKLGAKKYTDTVIICPLETSAPMKEFLNYWKIEFSEMPILLPARYHL